MIWDSNDKTNFSHQLLLTDRKILRPRKGFANKSSSNIRLSKNHVSKRMQSEGFLGRLLAPLLKTGLVLMKTCT